MFSKEVRYAFIALITLAGVWCFKEKYYVLVAFAAVLVLYVIWSYFKHGTVALAARYFRNKDFIRAQYYLFQIKNPDRLSVKRRGYYEFMLGNIALQSQDYARALQHFQIASTFPLHSPNDKSYVLLHLANLSLRNQEFERAQVYLDKAKQLNITPKVVSLIEKLEVELNKENK